MLSRTKLIVCAVAYDNGCSFVCSNKYLVVHDEGRHCCSTTCLYVIKLVKIVNTGTIMCDGTRLSKITISSTITIR